VGQSGGTYLRPKDSNAAVGRFRDRATGKALEEADRQTDRQTDFLSIIVRLHTCVVCTSTVPERKLSLQRTVRAKQFTKNSSHQERQDIVP